MTNEMVERVARAIYETDRSASDWDEENYRMTESVREEWRNLARAAIEASDFAELERYIVELEERVEQLETELEQIREDENEAIQ